MKRSSTGWSHHQYESWEYFESGKCGIKIERSEDRPDLTAYITTYREDGTPISVTLASHEMELMVRAIEKAWAKTIDIDAGDTQ